jgi:serine/threonine protein kinase
VPRAAVVPEFLGRYRIVKAIGEGGMGSVYLAEDTALGRKVAIKVPHLNQEDPIPLERFYREAQIAAQIEHPNLCAVFDYGQVDGLYYLVMPFIDGTPLSATISKNQPWPCEQAVHVCLKVARAVRLIHEKGYVHRDLKPSNIIMRTPDDPVLMDFGLARSYTSDSQWVTAAGSALGTPAYMPPEQIRGDAPAIGPHSDVYSLGSILYKMVVGALPFEGNVATVVRNVLTVMPKPPSQRNPAIDPALDRIILKSMAKKPADRYPTMMEFAQALESYLQRRSGSTSAAGPAGSRKVLVCQRCGQKMKMPAGGEGKRYKCPSCRQPIDMPRPPSAPSLPELQETAAPGTAATPPVVASGVLVEMTPTPAAAPVASAASLSLPSPHSTPAVVREESSEQSSNSRAVILGGIGAIILLLVLLIVLLIVLLTR